MKKSNTSLQVVGALVIGVLAGTALGLLFAPDKGKITRKKIVDNAKVVSNDLKQKISSELENLKNRAASLDKSDKLADLN